MATTANISYNNFEHTILSDGYPLQIIPNIIKIYENIKENKMFNLNTDYEFKSRGDYTLNYTYKILEDNKTLKFQGYDKSETIYFDLETLSNIYNNKYNNYDFKTFMEIFEETDLYLDYLNKPLEEIFNKDEYTDEEKKLVIIEKDIIKDLIVGLNIYESEFLKLDNTNDLDR